MLVRYDRNMSPLAHIFKELEEIERNFFQPLKKVDTDISIPVKFIEKEDRYEVLAEIPGVEKENISIDINNDILTISAIKKEEKIKDSDKVHFSYIEYGEFKQSIKLPKDIDLENVEAEYENGILKIKLPKVKKEGNIKRIVVK